MLRLWIDPYYHDGKPDDEKLLQLAGTLSATLELDDLTVLDGLRSLQRNALEKLEAREAMSKTNELQLKIKLAKGICDDLKAFTLSIDFDDTGPMLASKIASQIKGLDPLGIRLISCGRTISDSTLRQQGLKPGATVMAVKIDRDDHSLAVINEQRKILNTARSDAELMGDDDKLELTDQNGKEVDLPKHERNALILAMSLHEKGRAAMRKANHELALILLLEAADEYAQCRSALLSTVDNYGKHTILVVIILRCLMLNVTCSPAEFGHGLVLLEDRKHV